MNKHSSDAFLWLCKQAYSQKVTPANSKFYSESIYLELKKVALEYFNLDKYDEFATFLYEGQYLIDLWASHFILEFGRPNKILLIKSLSKIVDYSENPLVADVAEEEKKWLNEKINICLRKS